MFSGGESPRWLHFSFRRVATQYEKLKVTYLGMLHLVLGFIRLRKQRNVNRP